MEEPQLKQEVGCSSAEGAKAALNQGGPWERLHCGPYGHSVQTRLRAEPRKDKNFLWGSEGRP